MSIVDPDATHASEFLEYLDILPSYRLTEDPEHEELGQKKGTIDGYESHLSKAGNHDAKNGAKTRKQDGAGCVFVEEMGKAMDVNRQRARKFQALCYLCTLIVAACARTLINVEQYIDKVSTLECTLRIWGNEFPALCDLLTWKVPPLTFKLVRDRGLCLKLKGCL
ncbi:hypothetical protein GOBAR_DD05330 [Gossypium barbadense]|nr:hypothetical protein GOBAR_DD05330 [Gossypium barbadense]